MKHSLNLGLAPNVCPLCRHDPCDCETGAPPLDLGQFEGYMDGPFNDEIRSRANYWSEVRQRGQQRADEILHSELQEIVKEHGSRKILRVIERGAHAPAILDRARELEAEVIALKLQLAVDVMTLAPLQSQRDDLAGALRYIYDEHKDMENLAPRWQEWLENARAALARVQGDGDKEGGV